MYLPSSKIKIKTTTGGELYSSTKGEYIGKYIETSKGTYYSYDKTNPNEIFNKNKLSKKSLSKPLSDKKIDPSTQSSQYSMLRPGFHKYLNNTIEIPASKTFPTEEDYNKGYFLRYFVKKVNENNKYYEINVKTYDDITIRKNHSKYDHIFYEVGSILWALDENVIESNLNALNKKSTLFPYIKSIFPILNEFEKKEDFYIEGRTYINGDPIPVTLPKAYSLAKSPNQQKCQSCYLYKEGHCHKWKAAVKNNYWCRSWGLIPNKEMDFYSEFLQTINNSSINNDTKTNARPPISPTGIKPPTPRTPPIAPSSPTRGGGY